MQPGVAAVLLALAAAPAFPQTRPLQTEEADTAPAGRLLFETGFDAIADEPSYLTGAPRTRWDGPLLRFTYSPSDNVELDLEWVALVGASDEAGAGSVSDGGDFALRAKWRFLGSRPGRPSLAVRFGVTLPETSFNDASGRPLGLGPNTLRAFAEGLVTWPLGRARLHGNAGLLILDEVFRPHEQRDFLLYALALTLPLDARFEAVAEVAGRAGDGVPGAEERSEARVGLRFGGGRLRGDVALRRGLEDADGTWGGTVGLAWTIRPRRSPPAPCPVGPGEAETAAR
jgi:hypothetical protein